MANSIQTPFCGDLRTKKWYFLAAPATTEEELMDASNRAWCVRTMQSLGPDGELVNPETCRRGRGCYRGAVPEA
jgi:hypothetical protein